MAARPFRVCSGNSASRRLLAAHGCIRVAHEVIMKKPEPAGQRGFGQFTAGAPSRIRTCAHGSGGRCSIP